MEIKYDIEINKKLAYVKVSDLIQWLKDKKPYLDNMNYLIEELQDEIRNN